VTALALALVLVFTLLALLHVYWAMGGETPGIAGVPEVGGRPAFHPSAAMTLLVAGALAACAVLVAVAGDLVAVALPAPLVRWSISGLALVFGLRAIGDFRLVGFFKRVRGTRFARLDTLVYSPLCLAIAAGLATIASHLR